MKKINRRTQNTRQKIIKAALECFVKFGVSESWLTVIAKKAGVPHTLVLYHFPNREDLLREVINVVLDDLRTASINAIVQEESDPLKSFMAYAVAPLEWVHAKPHYFSLWLYFYYEASRSTVFEELNSMIRETGRQRIELLLHRINEVMPFKKGPLTISEVAYQAQSMMTGAVVMSFTERRRDLAKAKSSLCQSLSTLLRPSLDGA